MEQKELKPRYSRVSDIYEILLKMLGKPEGITLDEICNELNVSRRTAERIRDSLLNVCPNIGELEPSGKTKRWGFINYSLSEIVTFTEREIQLMEMMKLHWATSAMPEFDTILKKMKTLKEKHKA